MRLIAFDIFNVVVVEDNGVVIAYSKKGPPRVVDNNLVHRLGAVGFKEVSIDIESMEDAWAIANAEALKNFRVLY